MRQFFYTSHKHKSDQELLHRLSSALFVLKVQAQDQLAIHGLDEMQVQDSRKVLIKFLLELEKRVRHLALDYQDATVNLAFTGLADQFIKMNPADIPDRIDQLVRLRHNLETQHKLFDRDFRLLDRLQVQLQSEANEGVRRLYRL